MSVIKMLLERTEDVQRELNRAKALIESVQQMQAALPSHLASWANLPASPAPAATAQASGCSSPPQGSSQPVPIAKETLSLGPSGKSLAHHPNQSTGLMIRLVTNPPDSVLISWPNDFAIMKTVDVPASWYRPVNRNGDQLPVRFHRASVRSLIWTAVIVVEFLA